MAYAWDKDPKEIKLQPRISMSDEALMFCVKEGVDPATGIEWHSNKPGHDFEICAICNACGVCGGFRTHDYVCPLNLP